MKVGFGVFGRPITLEFVSNGLFKKLGVESETYLKLPNNVVLKPGETIAKISRQAVTNAGKSVEVIKVYVFSYALSNNKRPGGFVGSAYVFMGHPTQSLLYNAVKDLHQKALNLIDENKMFSSSDLGIQESDLISPNTDGLTKGEPLDFQGNTNQSKFILLDGPLIESLMIAVQGFIYNPYFTELNHIYVSSNKDLINRCVQGDQKRVWGFGRLLNFNKFYEDHLRNFNKFYEFHNTQLQKKRKEYNDLKSEIEEEREKWNDDKKELEKENQDLERKIGDKEKELSSLKTFVKGKEEKKVSLNKEIEILTKNKKKLEIANSKKILSIINDKSFARERKNFIENTTEFKELRKELDKVNEEKNNLNIINESRFPLKKQIAAILFGLFFLSGILLGVFAVPQSKNKTGYIENNTDPSTTVQESPAEKLTAVMPNEYSVKKFFELPLDSINYHKKKIDDYISELESEKPDKNKVDLNDFLNRKWNFAEVIDYNKDDIESGMQRHKKIVDLYKKYGEDSSFFEKEFMIDSFDKVKFDFEDFKTNKRNEILKLYLQKDNNIYKELSLQTLSDFEKLNLEEHDIYKLLYMHFRWIIFSKSNYEGKEKDLYRTSHSQHIIPIRE